MLNVPVAINDLIKIVAKRCGNAGGQTGERRTATPSLGAGERITSVLPPGQLAYSSTRAAPVAWSLTCSMYSPTPRFDRRRQVHRVRDLRRPGEGPHSAVSRPVRSRATMRLTQSNGLTAKRRVCESQPPDRKSICWYRSPRTDGYR